MTGTLAQKNGEWVIKYDRGHEVFFYLLDQKSQEWSKKESVIKFLHEGIELDFTLMTSGHYDDKEDSVVKEFSAKIQYINHETINKK
jgi:hypothetical protein